MWVYVPSAQVVGAWGPNGQVFGQIADPDVTHCMRLRKIFSIGAVWVDRVQVRLGKCASHNGCAFLGVRIELGR